MDEYIYSYIFLSKLTQDEVTSLNGLTTPSEIEAVIKKLPTKKSLGWMVSAQISIRPSKKN